MIPHGDLMENWEQNALLYDFYGELLTEHQRSVYEDVVFNDLSLGEVARERGISRQGVHDLIRRCDRILEDYENKLHLVRKFQQTRQMVEEIQNLCRGFNGSDNAELIRRVEKISDDILDL